MKEVSKVSKLSIATAAAALFLTGCAPMDADMTADGAMSKKRAEVKCSGVNACKGRGDCATATSECKGHNSCKGKGWVKASAKDCKLKGGKSMGKEK